MKNEPVVSYNHMEEETASKKNHVPVTLYVLLAIDAILISAIAIFIAKIVF